MKPTSTRLLRFLPVSLRSRIENSPNLRKIIANTSWLFADHALRLGVGLFVGVWVARYLGPEQFGLFNYAMAFVALFGTIASLGLNSIIVRDLVKEPETANAIMGTAFIMQVIGGLLAFVIVVAAISYVRPDDFLAKLVVAVLGSTMVFKASEVVKYWFESQVSSKFTVWVENTSFLLFAGVKVVLILCQATLMAFVWVVFAEAVLVSVALLVMYAWRGGNLRDWRVKKQRAKILLNDSWPLILSGLAIMVYMRIDQIMLGQMLGDDAVGVYSAAVRISEVWYFMPMAIVASMFPTIIEAKKQSEELYYQRLQKLYDLMVALALLVAVPMTFCSDWFIHLLFGEPYQEAGMVLTIHIWSGVFVSMGIARGKWLIVEDLQRFSYKYIIIAMIVNIVGNYVFIPIYGVLGSAGTTLLAQATTALIAPFFYKQTRISVFMMLRSMNPLRTIVFLRALAKND